MENLIEKIKSLRPTDERLKGKDPHYAFGYVQAINDIVAELKNCNLQSVNNNEVAVCECSNRDPEIKAMWLICANCGGIIKD